MRNERSDVAQLVMLETQADVTVIVALIFVIATKGRLGFVVKEKSEVKRALNKLPIHNLPDIDNY